ncbi:uncharacterized protein PG998_011977 [Apiospora kogelbergensis]|uniref:uncharacterized protein n=1 Tax=Apiospora kogelbergensis TaxID=1337665 RepID=UPI003131A856
MAPTTLTRETENIIATLDGIGAADVAGDREAQIAVATAARRMLARILLDLGLWKGWAEAGGGTATAAQLVDYCSPVAPDMNLLRRLLRYLAAEFVVEEVGANVYRPTAFSLELGKPASATTQALLVHDHHWRDSCRNFPSFLAKTGYQEPLDPAVSNYADWVPEKLPLFERMRLNPAYAASFTGWMAGLVGYKSDWTDTYDTQALVEGFLQRRNSSSDTPSEDQATLLVDIGGAHGLDVSSLLAKHPDLPAGCLVLQDLANVTAVAGVDRDQIRLMPHDFFTEQPVRGSRAYFLHAILHDWDDRDCRRILRRVAAAMEPGYSRLIVCDVAMPETGASSYQTAVDFGLMLQVSARERTETQWRLLLRSAGFRVVAISFPPVSGTEAIIEAELFGGDDDEEGVEEYEEYGDEEEE